MTLLQALCGFTQHVNQVPLHVAPLPGDTERGGAGGEDGQWSSPGQAPGVELMQVLQTAVRQEIHAEKPPAGVS